MYYDNISLGKRNVIILIVVFCAYVASRVDVFKRNFITFTLHLLNIRMSSDYSMGSGANLPRFSFGSNTYWLTLSKLIFLCPRSNFYKMEIVIHGIVVRIKFTHIYLEKCLVHHKQLKKVKNLFR